MEQNFHLQSFGTLTYKLKSAFDFSFLEKYGKVFKIFDDQDSGNICFGTKKGGKKYFIKFAGAPTAEYNGTPEDAILRLRETEEIYHSLCHKNLIRLIGSEEIGGGFAMVFEWAEGDCWEGCTPQNISGLWRSRYQTACKYLRTFWIFLVM